MRQIMSLVMDYAREDNRANNAYCAELSEVYGYLDRAISGISEPIPATGRLREALTVSDFPHYFERILSRMMYDRYQYRRSDWRDYTYADQVPDYSLAERFRMSEVERLEKRRDKEEAYATYLTESVVQVAVDDYAKQIDFSRRILKNDDLGAFKDVPLKLADSARRFEDVFVSASYDNALTQAALIALGVNYAGNGRLTTQHLATAINAFTQRLDGMGYPLNITPIYLVIPPVLELTANQILQSDRIAELATNAKNVLQNRVQVKIDPYIGFTLPNIPWYLFADPSAVPGVSVVRMQGETEEPKLYTKAPDKVPMTVSGGLGAADWRLGSFISGDIEIEVEIRIGTRVDAAATLVGVTDAQGIYYSTGTVP